MYFCNVKVCVGKTEDMKTFVIPAPDNLSAFGGCKGDYAVGYAVTAGLGSEACVLIDIDNQ